MYHEMKRAMETGEVLGVTYKTAWRMAKLIRSLMQQGGGKLTGVVEIDETYIGGKHKRKGMLDNKTAVIGMVEKKKGIGQFLPTLPSISAIPSYSCKF
jgi:transposase